MDDEKSRIQAVFEASYWRAANATVEGETFADSFYESFLEASPKARELFSGTDFAVQKRMFLLSIVYMGTLYTKNGPGHVAERLARKHRHVGVRPEMFDQWTESLLRTVRAYDPECDETVLEAWRVVLTPGIRYMVSVCTS